MINLKAKPFYLNSEQINTVEKMLRSMTDEEKAAQLICPCVPADNAVIAQEMTSCREYGAVMLRAGDAKKIQSCINAVQKNAKIPYLISGNLEDGGSGMITGGTYMGRQMLLAATGDNETAYRLGKICGREGAAIGANWAFAPVVDIDLNFRNPITNVRTYGSDHERVIRMGTGYIKGLTEEGLIPSVKHFPGDGHDERDQHLLTSVNGLSIEEWEASYGQIYRAMIEQGAKTAMIGHIAMPAMEEKFGAKPCDKVIPASVSKNIMTNYLRGELNFNGLIVTDSSTMIGLMSNTQRHMAIPSAIENGADMLLFVKDITEDISFLLEGIKTGILSRARLDEAVTRILAVKASLRLFEKKFNGTIYKTEKDLAVIGCAEHVKWAAECADKGVTLVKDTQNLLPLNPKRHKRVLLEILGDFPSNERVTKHFASALVKEGFETEIYKPETKEECLANAPVSEFKNKYDLVFYVGNIENASNKTTARINWHTFSGRGNNLPWFAKEIPTIFVSVGNPYHLFDAPMVQTYINGYCHSPYVIDAVIEKIMGRSEFKGISPVDAFCGVWDTRF
jgi:beta-N-acetylhexosaminidase